MDFLIILLILVIIAMVIASLLYAYDSRFVFVTSEWKDIKAWFKESKNQAYVIAGAVCLLVILVLIFFIRRANHKHDVWVKSNDKFIEIEDNWLTSLRLIDVDGVKGINKGQVAKFKREIAENEKDVREMEHILADRKVNPQVYTKLSKADKQGENDFVSATRTAVADRNESIKSFIKRNEKKLGKSAVKIAKQDIKTSQKMIGTELRKLQKEQKAGTFGLEEEIRRLQEDKAALKLRIESMSLWSPLNTPLVANMPVLAADMSDAIRKAENEEGWSELSTEWDAIEKDFKELTTKLGDDLEESEAFVSEYTGEISDEAHRAFEDAHFDDLEHHV